GLTKIKKIDSIFGILILPEFPQLPREVVMSPVIGNHADVLAILNAPEQWSNRVSTHLNVPNGMDAPEHTLYRAIIEPFFDHTTMAQFEGVVRSIVRKIFAELPEH